MHRCFCRLRTVGCLQLAVYVTAGRPQHVECHNVNVTRGRKSHKREIKISLRVRPFVVQRCSESKLMFPEETAAAFSHCYHEKSAAYIGSVVGGLVSAWQLDPSAVCR